jgi:tRNA (adenine57-N1/adenine58-N1)-methyltransferase
VLVIQLQTRTQIVDEVDSSVITLNLDVHPGFTVVETGTGSGCMTMSLARAVHPSGHVYTFEYNGVRAQKAREEFDKCVTKARHRCSTHCLTETPSLLT